MLSIVRNTACSWLGKHRDPRLVTVADPAEAEAAQADSLPWEPGAATPEAGLDRKGRRGPS